MLYLKMQQHQQLCIFPRVKNTKFLLADTSCINRMVTRQTFGAAVELGIVRFGSKA